MCIKALSQFSETDLNKHLELAEAMTVQDAGSMLRAESGIPCIAKQAHKLPMYQKLGEDF